jgi:hypothetical protein
VLDRYLCSTFCILCPISTVIMLERALVLLFAIIYVECFQNSALNRFHRVALVQGKRNELSMSNDKWPGDRPPIPKVEFLTQFMDAAWGRGKFRTEVWEDDVNPMNLWWEVYGPSDEEKDAANGNFGFGNAKEWCKEKGIDYEQAMEKYNNLVKKVVEDHTKSEEKSRGDFSMETFANEQEKFMALQRRAFEVAFRIDDDENQKRKGQPSLDDEDDGKQYKND